MARAVFGNQRQRGQGERLGKRESAAASDADMQGRGGRNRRRGGVALPQSFLLLGLDRAFVRLANQTSVAVELHPTAVDPDESIAETRGGVDVMGDEQECGAACRAHLPHALVALVGEVAVTDTQQLVDDQDLRLEHGRGGEHQPRRHARRIGLHRLVDEALKFGELDDIVEQFVGPTSDDAEMSEARVDVLPTGEVGMEPGSDLEQGADHAVDRHGSLRRSERAGDQLEKRALAGAVATDDGDLLAALDGEGHVAKGVVLGVGLGGRRAESEQVEHSIDRLAVEAIGLAHSAHDHRRRRCVGREAITHGRRRAA